ncbi:glycosyltransferase [Roseiconus nitratireducens]|uniref:Glycosyltransferase n=2 Tax=Roseiconus nitratireducens TaxID=2605748 RepID=A0A5M6CYM3_9BACT|nr:glycosyltransferase [Roseiconus nitratireducens]
MLSLAILAAILSAIPALMFLANLPRFCDLVDMDLVDRESAEIESPDDASVSVLIPARDEQAGIADCLRHALASERVRVEVIVLDDQSTDATAEIVSGAAKSDDRVRLLHGRPLPEGWNGKQHACRQLADAAAYDRFAFLDADVHLAPMALRRLVDHQDVRGVGLLSAFPHQRTGTWLEAWLIPIMHYVLLGFLPFGRMRADVDPNLAAGCGQLFLSTRQAYRQAGTHEAIKASRHDGLKLPRGYRRAGIMTDVIDGTDLADCRMYRGAAEVIHGVLKNAIEGIANPRLIVLFTVLLLGASLLPVVALIGAIAQGNRPALYVSIVAVLLSHLPRLIAAARFRQSWFGAICHVPAMMTFVALQWVALANHLMGRKIAWRGRSES